MSISKNIEQAGIRLQCRGKFELIWESVFDMGLGHNAERNLWFPLEQEYSLAGVVAFGNSK